MQQKNQGKVFLNPSPILTYKIDRDVGSCSNFIFKTISFCRLTVVLRGPSVARMVNQNALIVQGQMILSYAYNFVIQIFFQKKIMQLKRRPFFFCSWSYRCRDNLIVESSFLYGSSVSTGHSHLSPASGHLSPAVLVQQALQWSAPFGFAYITHSCGKSQSHAPLNFFSFLLFV